ncbi:MAG: MATE family efflux transporter [Oscillospiraceae bacterium]|nr:MATE family efflux transporter [Oscillospiraceae bacterium]
MNKHSDLTAGGIFHKLTFVALPIMGTQLIQMLYNLTDMFWLGRLSSDDVAASGTAGMYLWLGMALLLFGRMGAEIGVSQNKGGGDIEAANAFARNSFTLSLILGIFYSSALVFFDKSLMSVFNIREPYVAEASADYLCIVGLGVTAVFMSAAITGIFNGAGNSRVPFYAHASGLIINMILDPLMIFTFGLGIHGAAAATALAQWIVFGLLFWAVKRHRDRPFKRIIFLTLPDRGKIWQIVHWALPISIESGLFCILTMAVGRLIAGFGSEALAVHRVATQIEALSWLVGSGFGSAVTAFVGQNYGARKWDRISSGFRISSAVMFAWGCIITFTLYFGGYILFSLFLPEIELRNMGAVYLKVLAFCQLPACLEAVGAGFFRGIGRTIPPSSVSIGSNILRVPVSYWFASMLGLYGVWWALSATAMLRGVVNYGWALIALFNKVRSIGGD